MTHIGRAWGGPSHIEALCPCPLAPCGLVSRDDVDPACEQHPPERCKTIRTGHSEADCPGFGRRATVALGAVYQARNAVIDAARLGPEGYFSLDLLEALDDFRRAVAHEQAERIREAHKGPGRTWDWWDAATIPDECADLIDPEVAT